MDGSIYRVIVLSDPGCGNGYEDRKGIGMACFSCGACGSRELDAEKRTGDIGMAFGISSRTVPAGSFLWHQRSDRIWGWDRRADTGHLSWIFRMSGGAGDRDASDLSGVTDTGGVQKGWKKDKNAVYSVSAGRIWHLAAGSVEDGRVKKEIGYGRYV